jgi:hypothetical protein
MYDLSEMAALIKVAKHMKKIMVDPEQFLNYYVKTEDQDRFRGMLNDLNLIESINDRKNWWDEDNYITVWA